MAVGDVKWFAQGLHDLGNGLHDLDTHTFKLGIVTGVTPTVATAIPHWGGTGTTNYASNQVAVGGTSYTGPKTLTSVTWVLSATGGTFDFADIAMAQDASGFTNGAYGIIYNDSNAPANKHAIAFVQLATANDASLVVGAINISTPSGVLSLAQS